MQARKPTAPDLFAEPPRAGSDASETRVYERLRRSPKSRAHVNAMWRRYSELGLADHGFAKRFAVECTARLWEIHLAFVFDSWGWPLRPSKRLGAGPDFGVALKRGQEERVMWIEATAPQRGDGQNRSDFHDIGNGMQACFNDGGRAESLRILHAIREKLAQRKKWIENGIVGETDGFAIAISGAHWDPADSALVDRKALPVVVRCLYGLDQMTWEVPRDGGAPRRGPRTHRSAIEKRRDGAQQMISSSLFTSRDNPELSCVLFCDNHLDGLRRLGSDLVLVHNPTATTSMPFKAMKRGREFFMRMDEVRHRSLLGLRR